MPGWLPGRATRAGPVTDAMRHSPELTGLELTEALAQRPGLIPFQIDSPNQQVHWLDFERYHFYEGFFRLSVSRYRALCKVPPFECRTSLDVLSYLTMPDALPPSALIFNTGRCGSTLLAKVLARSRRNLVITEAAPHNQIWQALPTGSLCQSTFRNLILATGRNRLRSYQAHVIKFTSVNIVHFDFIRAAFPGIPVLFLFRDPSAVLESYSRRDFEWKDWMGGSFGSWDGPAQGVEDICNRALSVTDSNFRCLDYSALNPDSLGSITDFLGLQPGDPDGDKMRSEFRWDSKSDQRPVPFIAAGLPGHGTVPHSLQTAYDSLRSRSEADWGQF